MNPSWTFLKKLLTPVTILVVPHSCGRPVGFRVPVLGVVAAACLLLTGTGFVASMAVRAAEYREMQTRLAYLSSQFHEIRGVAASLREAERDFRRLLGMKSKAAVLKAVDPEDTGSFDLKALREQLDESMRSVEGIRDYLRDQKDLYRATPAGWPVPGRLTSRYGSRLHPVDDETRFHSGLDISVPPGTPVKATAEGVVSFAGWSAYGGYVVVVEHGRGFRTAYAHNREMRARVGQRIARGDTIAVSGSTGVSTGPHLHYEVWKNGRHTDPVRYLEAR